MEGTNAESTEALDGGVSAPAWPLRDMDEKVHVWYFQMLALWHRVPPFITNSNIFEEVVYICR